MPPLSREYAICKNPAYICFATSRVKNAKIDRRVVTGDCMAANEMIAKDGSSATEAQAGRKPLSPAAQRALAEAEARRRAAEAQPAPSAQKEYQGPAGPEPTRYGDWERKGIASDF